MKVTPFYSLSGVGGNSIDFHRKNGRYCKGGVYMWGFSLSEHCTSTEPKEVLISYIGVSKSNIPERIMQEVTQLVFGGFGTIVNHKWLESNPFKARLIDLQESNPLDSNVLYKSDGLHVLNDFFHDVPTQETVRWMRERLIFSWIEIDDYRTAKALESELHHIVRTNCFGVGRIKKLTPKKDIKQKNQTPLFHSVDWSNNEQLRDWLIEVNKSIT